MEVKIGVVYTAKELNVDVSGSPDDVVALVDSALGGDAAVLWLTDRRGRRIGIPTDKLAYVEFGEDDGERRVGFARS